MGMSSAGCDLVSEQVERLTRFGGLRPRTRTRERHLAQPITSFPARIGPAAPDTASALGARMREACACADALIAHSRRLRHLRAIARDGDALVCRCAWCERFQVDQQWLSLAELPALRRFRERVSHGICPECIAGLRRSGLSK
jgi:hypothetical protein